jgi:Leucine Rich Repeat.
MSLKLKSLKLQDNKITDVGLKILSKMSSLEALDLSDCVGITRSGGQNFSRVLPKCTLEFDPCDRLDLVPERP